MPGDGIARIALVGHQNSRSLDQIQSLRSPVEEGIDSKACKGLLEDKFLHELQFRHTGLNVARIRTSGSFTRGFGGVPFCQVHEAVDMGDLVAARHGGFMDGMGVYAFWQTTSVASYCQLATKSDLKEFARCRYGPGGRKE